MRISFYLTPDKFSAHHIRRKLTQKEALLGFQVGTWPELLELARNSYCLPLPDDDWQEKIKAGITQVNRAFWQESLVFDPEATTIIISQALSDLLWAIGPEQKITTKIAKGFSKRGNRHIKDLLALHEKIGRTFPADLSLIQALLTVKEKHALRTVKVHYVADISNLTSWQTALVNRLNERADNTNRTNTIGENFSELISWLPSVREKSGLRHLQRTLFTKTKDKQKSRSGLQWLATRDYLQEVEVAAGMVQQLMATSDVAANEIALLLPESPDYSRAAAEVFRMAGIPLAGLTTISNTRDLGSEILYHFLLCRKSATPAPMLMASLFGSPLLPWNENAGQISQEIMDGVWLSSILEGLPEDQQKTGRFLYGKQITSPVRLVKSLRGLTAIIAKGEDLAEHRQTALALIRELLTYIDEEIEDIDWEVLLRTCSPNTLSQKEQEDITREGVRVFHPDREPWRMVQHLLILGFSEGNYPRPSAVFPVIPEQDRLLLKAQDILISTRGSLLEQRRKRFLRQLCSASQSITFLVPMLDSMGGQLKPSSSLGFMAQLFDGVESGDDLILDLEQPKDRKRVKNLAIASEQNPTPLREIISDDLELWENLLTKRKDSEGKTAPESPSGLEKMMVSPLAWLFKRYSIESLEWSSEELDVMTIGSIAHEIFECLFRHQNSLPQRGRISGKIESIFNQVIKKDYPFLIKDEWQVECQQMIREFTEAAIGWLDFLKKNRLEILGEETWLAGRFNKHPIRGKADLICRASNGNLLVVDYKTSKSYKRKDSMAKGFDHQASLYCQMLGKGKLPDKIPLRLRNYLKKSPDIGALYYTLRDQVVLGDSKADFLEDVEVVTADIAQNGLTLIKQRMKELRAGIVSLNSEKDNDWFKAEAGITPYALDDTPLINMFMKEGEE